MNLELPEGSGNYAKIIGAKTWTGHKFNQPDTPADYGSIAKIQFVVAVRKSQLQQMNIKVPEEAFHQPVYVPGVFPIKLVKNGAYYTDDFTNDVQVTIHRGFPNNIKIPVDKNFRY